MSNEEFRLKLRFMRLLWNNGYFVRHEVPVFNPSFVTEIQDMTDIDVYGIKLDSTFSKELAFCECKTGKNVSTYDRLFWLSGLKKYFNVSKAYLLKSDLNEEKYMDIAHLLEVMPLSKRSLEKVEQLYNINPDKYWGYFDQSKLNKGEAIFLSLKKLDKNLHFFLKYKYWNYGAHEKVKKLINAIKDVNKNYPSLKEDTYNFLLMYILTLLSLAILDCCKKAYLIPKERRTQYVVNWLRGGKGSIDEMENIAAAFYDFMKSEFKKKCNYKYGINKKSFVGILSSRPYFNDLVDLIERFCNNPEAAILVPKLLDLVNYEKILGGKKTDLKLIPELENCSDEFREICIKLTKNIFIFIRRQKLVTEDKIRYLDSLF